MSSSQTLDLSGLTIVSKPTEGSIFGALKYNLNEMFSWRFGYPTYDEISLYSDYSIDGLTPYISDVFKNHVFAVDTPNIYPDPSFVNLVDGWAYTSDAIWSRPMDASSYELAFASSDSLFSTYFPWNVTGIQDSSGIYHVKNYMSSFETVKVNPLRREVLKIKLFTTLKISGIILGIYLLIKLIFRLSKK